jgi:hypothetical protein
MFLIEKGDLAYLVSVVHMEKGTGPKNPDQKYFQKLMKNLHRGSTTTLRTSKSRDDSPASPASTASPTRQFGPSGADHGVGRPRLHV